MPLVTTIAVRGGAISVRNIAVPMASGAPMMIAPRVVASVPTIGTRMPY